MRALQLIRDAGPARTFTFLSLLLMLAAWYSLRSGTSSFDWQTLLAGLRSADPAARFTLWEYRLPRLLLALLVGALLAGAGALVQGVIRNPLASPDVLGISHGASLAAVLALMLWPALPSSTLPLVALLGGLLAALALWWLCGAGAAPLKLALGGVALSALYASCIDYLLLTRPQDVNQALLWLTGSLWGRSWSSLWHLLPWLMLLPLALWLSQSLNLLALGDEAAASLGIAPVRVRLLALAVAVGWSAASVATCGPLGFLALVAPHLARRLVGGRHQLLLPAAMLIGALLLTLADLAGRVLAPPLELPAGIMTALLGAPYFLYLLARMRSVSC